MENLKLTLDRLKEQADNLLEEGQAQQALEAANTALEKFPDDALGLAAILEIRGKIHNNIGLLEEARADYERSLEYLDEAGGDDEMAGNIHAAVGVTCCGLDDKPSAVRHWQLAIGCFEKHDPPLNIDIAAISNNLGFLYKSEGDMDSAENCFLKALDILNNELGHQDEQTATVFCNLGTLYHQAGFYEQSRKMHREALNTRLKILGSAHPDTAQSHNNIALALAAGGENEEAKQHFQDALQAFSELGEDFAEDLEAVRENYSRFLADIGEGEGSLAGETV